MARILNGICAGHGSEGDIQELEVLGRVMVDASLCALGGTAPNPVLSNLRYFRDEFEAHVLDRRCPAGVCRALITYSIDPERCNGCALCARACPAAAITGEIKQLHVIDPNVCDQCGTCYDACKVDAIIRI